MRNVRLLIIVFSLCICFTLSWCWNNLKSKNQTLVEVSWYNLVYNGNALLEKIGVKSDDPSEIIELYQEVWDNSEFRDSLLIAEKYARWMWVFAFSQDNLQALKDQDLKLENIKKIPVSTKKNKDMLIVEYEITEWFIPEVPLLYVSQFFIPDDENIILMSFMSEDANSRDSASEMFENIE